MCNGSILLTRMVGKSLWYVRGHIKRGLDAIEKASFVLALDIVF